MTERFALTMLVTKSDDLDLEFEHDDFLGSTGWLDEDFSSAFGRDDIEKSVKESEAFKALPNGDYRVFVSGIAEFESSVDWESGHEEGSFYYTAEKVMFEKLDPADKVPPTICPECNEEIHEWNQSWRDEGGEPLKHSSCHIKKLEEVIERAKRVVRATRDETLDLNEARRQFEELAEVKGDINDEW